MFEITSNDISLLNDEDLRTLVGRLCESEVRSRGLSTSFVTWGGNQNAADGGLDVRVALPGSAGIDGFVPRPATGFQVKKEDMPRGKILAEMCPFGVLRSVIRELANQSGAYVIVSSEGSTSDIALRNRRKAMEEAVKDLPNAKTFSLDFYDRTRLATWVRDHPGLIPWVREKIGKPIQGWHSYGAWAYAPDGVSGEYLLDDKLRIHTGKEEADGGIQALEGIRRIRDSLHEARTVVRLVGLSGVGKTRFVQALFDDRIGENSLDPSLAIYTNMADGPDPQPIGLATDLITGRTRAILVIDNCPPDLHGRLSEFCRSPESLVSLITVEYDIREDQPEGTDVFSLEPSSTDLIDKLIRHRFSEISPVNARTVAELSDGNARVAIVLAGTVGENETIASLPDQNLLKRLIHQRNEPSESLLLAAQALSLVYSYQGDDISCGNQSELFTLGALVGKSPQEMFRNSAELQRRELVQKRGVWRAVLPHAIANRLAATALENIPSAEIEARLIEGAPGRLQKSFSRRLGYLGSSKEAKAIVTRWLGSKGRLEDVVHLNDLNREIFKNIAPVVPEATLSALERALLNPKNSETVAKCGSYVHLLRSLAFDPALFGCCIELILTIAEAQDLDKDANEASKVFASLFPICFSGTHATLDQRLAVTKSLLLSKDPKRRTLGSSALRAMLEATHFGPPYNFEFGTRSRDYGYWPRSRDEVKRWFGRTLSLGETLACSDEASAPQVCTLLAEQFRGLWTGAAMYDELEHVCHGISKGRSWIEGWIAVRQTVYYDSKGFSPEISARLASLEALLRPSDLVQKVRSTVLSEDVLCVGVDSTNDGTVDVEKNIAQVETMAHELGRAVAVDQDTLTELLPGLIAGSTQQLWSFGGGLAEGSEEPRAIWSTLVTHLAAAPPDKRNPHLFRGFLNSLRTKDPNLLSALLDDALENEALAQWFPVLQSAVGIDKEGANRLMRSLDLDKAWIGSYRILMAGGVTHQICGADFSKLVLRIAEKPGGLDIAIEIFGRRLSFDDAWRQSSTSEIIDVGCELMRQLRFMNRRNDSANYTLGKIAWYCLVEEKGAVTVREICHNLKEAVSKSETSAFFHEELLQILLDAQPIAALEALCGDNATDLKLGIRILDQAARLRRNAFDSVPEDYLVSWCDQQPDTRYPAAAAGVTSVQPSGDTGRPQWTSTALKLLDKAPDRVEVLKKFIGQFSPMSWAGSRAGIVESNAKLLDELAGYPDTALVEFIAKEKVRLAEAIKMERQTETLFDKERDERFE
jgi:hypothetical protein